MSKNLGKKNVENRNRGNFEKPARQPPVHCQPAQQWCVGFVDIDQDQDQDYN